MNQITTAPVRQAPMALAFCLALACVACGDDGGGGPGRIDGGTGGTDGGAGGMDADDPDDPMCLGACVSCADLLAYGCDPETLCPEEAPAFEALFNCVCAGPCAGPCRDNACAGGDLSADCTSCVGESCGMEAAACSGP